MENKKISQQINNVVADNIEKLKTIFPNVVKDGIVDFKALELELREITEEETEQKERYDFTWAGKTKAKKNAQEDIYCKTLNYIEGDGKDEDTTQNLYIEGDNLEVLKLLRQNYYGAIKMIYIDPPYNTGNDFIYNDNFIENSVESDIKEGIRNEEGARLEQNGKSSNNKYHGKWLTMMYPRLKIARDLLTEDGVIFISIDDNEVHNLRKICDEIFGEINFVGQYSWYKSATPPNLSKKIKKNLEYILCYEKSMNNKKYKGILKVSNSDNGLLNQSNSIKILEFPEMTIQTKLKDGVYNCGIYGTDSYSIELLNDVEVKNGFFITKVILKAKFKWKQDKLLSEIKNKTRIFIKTNSFSPSYEKIEYEPESPPNLIDNFVNVTTTENAGKYLQHLMDNKKVFDYPKPINLIKYLFNFIGNKDDIILDFFSGSSTTAHAVMQLNVEDGGNRKYIMVQLQEECKQNTEAYKFLESINKPKNICEIGKERIRRAGEKIKEEIEKYNTQLKLDEEPKKIPDIGFKVFRVANTNIKWNNIQNMGQLDVNTLKDKPDQIDFILNAKDKDIVYEIMLRQKNIPLTSKIILLDNIGNRTYIYANLYLICLETNITDELIEKLSQINPLPRKFIFRDSAFGEDCNRKEKTFRLLDNLIKKNYGEDTYNIEFI